MAKRIPVSAEITDLLDSIHRRMRHAARAQFQPLGLTPAMARAMRVIGRSANPLRMSELADHLRIARRSATSIVDELADRRLVDRLDDPNDRRAVTVVLSEAGHATMHEMQARRRAAGAQLLTGLNADEQRALLELLRKLEANAPPHEHKHKHRH